MCLGGYRGGWEGGKEGIGISDNGIKGVLGAGYDMNGTGALHGHYMSAVVRGLDIGNEWTNLNNILTTLLTGTNRNSCTVN